MTVINSVSTPPATALQAEETVNTSKTEVSGEQSGATKLSPTAASDTSGIGEAIQNTLKELTQSIDKRSQILNTLPADVKEQVQALLLKAAASQNLLSQGLFAAVSLQKQSAQNLLDMAFSLETAASVPEPAGDCEALLGSITQKMGAGNAGQHAKQLVVLARQLVDPAISRDSANLNEQQSVLPETGGSADSQDLAKTGQPNVMNKNSFAPAGQAGKNLPGLLNMGLPAQQAAAQPSQSGTIQSGTIQSGTAQPGQPETAQPGTVQPGPTAAAQSGQTGGALPGQSGTSQTSQPGMAVAGQPDAVQSGQSGTAVTGQTGVIQPGRPGLVLPGQPGAAQADQPGPVQSSLPGQPTTQPGQPDAAQPGQGSAAAPSQQGTAQLSQPRFAQPGQPAMVQPGQPGMVQPGQSGMTLSGLQAGGTVLHDIKQLLANLTTDITKDQLQTAAKPVETLIPQVLRQAAAQHGLADLPTLWALLKIVELNQWKNIDRSERAKAGADLKRLAQLFAKETVPQGENVSTHTVLSYSMPLYFGDNPHPYPAYIHIYHQREQTDREQGEYETWLRIALDTQNIGMVDASFRLYDGEKVDVRVGLGDYQAVESFSQAVPDIRTALAESPLTLQVLAVNKLKED